MRHGILALSTAGFVLASAAAANGQSMDTTGTYEVTITNLTHAQVVTPPLLVTHDPDFSLFEPGTMASVSLATLAETGAPDDLANEIAMVPEVGDIVIGAGIMPGESLTLEITSGSGARLLSFAAMLAVTNDAFATVRGIELPRRFGDPVTVKADAYDAGSEENLETDETVPALPAGNARATANSEGFIHIHRGIHGGADLDPAVHDWRNPVVALTIERVMP